MNKNLTIPSMEQIASDARNLSNFRGNPNLFAAMVEDEGFDEDEYDGFDDDDVSFDGKKKSFEDQHTGQRLLALTIDNSANATDVNVGIFGSQQAAFALAGEGVTTSIEGTAIRVTSNGITKLVVLQKYFHLNPTKVVGMRESFGKSDQAGKTITQTYNDPFKSKKETVYQPETFRSERNPLDKIITIPCDFTIGNQTDLIVQVAAGERLNFFIMFGGVYNTSKSLSRKYDRAAINLTQ